MKFGAHILPIYTPELEGPLPEFYRRLFEQIVELEKLGFDQAWVTEHHSGGYGGSLPLRQGQCSTQARAAAPPADLGGGHAHRRYLPLRGQERL